MHEKLQDLVNKLKGKYAVREDEHGTIHLSDPAFPDEELGYVRIHGPDYCVYSEVIENLPGRASYRYTKDAAKAVKLVRDYVKPEQVSTKARRVKVALHNICLTSVRTVLSERDSRARDLFYWGVKDNAPAHLMAALRLLNGEQVVPTLDASQTKTIRFILDNSVRWEEYEQYEAKLKKGDCAVVIKQRGVYAAFSAIIGSTEPLGYGPSLDALPDWIAEKVSILLVAVQGVGVLDGVGARDARGAFFVYGA